MAKLFSFAMCLRQKLISDIVDKMTVFYETHLATSNWRRVRVRFFTNFDSCSRSGSERKTENPAGVAAVVYPVPLPPSTKSN